MNVINDDFKKKSTGTSELLSRMKFNKNSLFDFDNWCINLLPPLKLPSNILDLGCGTGKQTILFSKYLTDKSNIHAYDISNDSINFLKNKYTNRAKLNTYVDSFENIINYSFEDNKFDLIYSFYALYYANNLIDLIEYIHKILKNDSYFWVVNPFEGNNHEIFDILGKYYEFNEKVFYSSEKFYKELISLCENLGFKSLKINFLNNKIFYYNKNKLFEYIKNTTFYNKDYKKNIKEDIENIFNRNDKFSLSKNIISMKFHKKD